MEIMFESFVILTNFCRCRHCVHTKIYANDQLHRRVHTGFGPDPPMALLFILMADSRRARQLEKRAQPPNMKITNHFSPKKITAGARAQTNFDSANDSNWIISMPRIWGESRWNWVKFIVQPRTRLWHNSSSTYMAPKKFAFWLRSCQK